MSSSPKVQSVLALLEILFVGGGGLGWTLDRHAKPPTSDFTGSQIYLSSSCSNSKYTCWYIVFRHIQHVKSTKMFFGIWVDFAFYKPADFAGFILTHDAGHRTEFIKHAFEAYESKNYSPCFEVTASLWRISPFFIVLLFHMHIFAPLTQISENMLMFIIFPVVTSLQIHKL